MRDRSSRRTRLRVLWEAVSDPRFDHHAGDSATPLHEERLDAVVQELTDCGATSVLDLGCGSGALLRRLLSVEQFTTIVGVDASAEALLQAEGELGESRGSRVSLEHASFTDASKRWCGFDAAAMVETIEHVRPGDLSRLERSVFAVVRPSVLVLTTPNREYNVRLGLGEGELRHPEHEFEWDPGRFRRWAAGVAERNGFTVRFRDVGRPDPVVGSPTQMAVFRRSDP